MKDLQLYSWVKEANVPPCKSILLNDWARRMKRNEARWRCVLKDFATTMRKHTCTNAITNISERTCVVRNMVRSSRVGTGDLVCAFMQADTSCGIFARPVRSKERGGWFWRLHGAMNGTRTESRDLTDFLVHSRNAWVQKVQNWNDHEFDETRVVSHVDDPRTCAEPVTLDKICETLTPHIPVVCL